jgi:hypothetical protein
MKCGERGHRTVHGLPCGQEIAESAPGCIWHSRTPEERSELASRSQLEGQRRRKRVLPGSTPHPLLSDPAARQQVLADTIQQVRTGQLDPQRGSVVIAGVRAAGEEQRLETEIQIAEVLARFDYGGPAMIWFSQVRQGPRRPLPGPALVASPPPLSEPA